MEWFRRFLISSFIILPAVLFVLVDKTEAVESTRDQFCIFNPSYNRWSSQILIQSFVPTQNRLAEIKLRLCGASQAKLKILDSQNNVLSEKMISNGTEPCGLNTYTFEPIPLTPGQVYKLSLSEGSSDLSWAYTADDNCYDGITTVDGQTNNLIQAFYFETYGYDQVAEAEQSSSAASDEAPAASSAAAAATSQSSSTSAAVSKTKASQSSAAASAASSSAISSTSSDSTIDVVANSRSSAAAEAAALSKQADARKQRLKWIAIGSAGAGFLILAALFAFILTRKKKSVGSTSSAEESKDINRKEN